MSRIDDALRRADASLSEPPAGVAAVDTFVSPWTVGDDRVARSASNDKDGGRVLDLDPPDDPAPRLRVVRPSLLEGFNPELRKRLTVSEDADRLLVHQFHRLAATLLQAQRAQHLKSVMITSASPQDGKTLTALNLALVLSQSYRRRVLLIEADLRRPGISSAANLPLTSGLGEAIKASADRKVPLVQLTETLTLLPAGRPDPDPLSGLASPRMKRLMQEAAEQFDWVIVDTPPLGATADAGLLCPLVDAAVLVIRAGRTAHAAVQAAIETLGRDRILGVVLNGVDHEVASGYDASDAEYSKP